MSNNLSCFGNYENTENSWHCKGCPQSKECKGQGKAIYKRPSKEEYYLGIALAVSKRSTCLKRHYGAVIVKDGEIIATGYNGAPRGSVNCCDLNECNRMGIAHNAGDYSECRSVHAEQNAIISAPRRDMIGATLYLTGEEEIEPGVWEEIKYAIPCPICSRMIKNSGIEKVFNGGGEVCL